MNWALLVVKSNGDDVANIKTTIYQYITTVLLPLCGKEITVDADNFFNAISNRIQNAQVVEQGNIYHGTDIDVEVATVHAVKGETHASTLYLETFLLWTS
mgnify:FL=1